MTEQRSQTQMIPELKAIPAAELLDTTYEPCGALIDGLIGQGIYILAGAPKVGKSWMVLWLADQISKGEPVWGMKTEKCGVLYISLEDTYQRMQKRLNDVSGGNPGSIFLTTEALYIGEGFEEQLIHFLTGHPFVKLVIIDTFQRIRKSGQEQYNYASDYETVCALKKIADHFLMTILLVHHTRKTGSNDSFNMISGTTGLLGCADGALVLQKASRLTDAATLDVTGREVADLQLNLRFDKQKKVWEFVSFGIQPQAEEKHPVLLAVQSFIREEREWQGYAGELLEKLKAKGKVEAEPQTLTRLMNAHITELANQYGVLYRSGKRTEKGRCVYLKDIHVDDEAEGDRDHTATENEGSIENETLNVDNVGNDGISEQGAGSENTYIRYITVSGGSEGA